jgi:hypothetical protein
MPRLRRSRDHGWPGHDGDDDPRAEPCSTSSMPSIMTEMLEALRAEPGNRVLEIGTGSGYNTALLCERLSEGDHRGRRRSTGGGPPASDFWCAGYTRRVAAGDGAVVVALTGRGGTHVPLTTDDPVIAELRPSDREAPPVRLARRSTAGTPVEPGRRCRGDVVAAEAGGQRGSIGRPLTTGTHPRASIAEKAVETPPRPKRPGASMASPWLRAGRSAAASVPTAAGSA